MWVPIVVVAVLAIGFLVVIALAAQQRAQRRRRRAARLARRRCGGCGQLLRAPLQVGERCPLCGFSPPLPSALLEFIYGPLEGQTYHVEAEITTIGSQPGNSIVLPDPAVSRKHIGIRRDMVGYELADLGSTNGVYVNGERLAKRVLAPGDIIRIGSSEMVFQLQQTSDTKVG